MSDPDSDAVVGEASKLSSRLIYEVVLREGDEELERPLNSLVWSGIAAGVLMTFSLLGQAILRTHLPDAPASFLVEKFGYSLGFLMVILGKMQLFTENTITTVLPVVTAPSRARLIQMARLWTIVLLANVAGALAGALLLAFTPATPPELSPALAALAQHAMAFSPLEAFSRAVPAGLLVAAIVWMLPQVNGGGFWVILLFTWLIGAADLSHVVVGAVEMWFLVLRGDLGPGGALLGFFLPVLAGNIVGGTAIFTLLAWGQVKEEVADES